MQLVQNLQCAISMIQNQVLEYADKKEIIFNVKLKQMLSVAEQFLENITSVNVIEVIELKDHQAITERESLEVICGEEKPVCLQKTVVQEQILSTSESSIIKEQESKGILQASSQQFEQVFDQPILIAQSGKLKLFISTFQKHMLRVV